MIKINHATLATCGEATGIVVVIDVLRAFSTSAYALAAGVEEIILVSRTAEAFELQEIDPNFLLVGEVEGLPVEGFDYGNSPAPFVGNDFTGQKMILRSSAGTQGVVLSKKADLILVSSLVCSRATAKYLQGQKPDEITFVITGSHSEDGGEEDLTCADYVEALVRGEEIGKEVLVQRVRQSAAARKFLDPNEGDFPISDLEYSVDIDRFNFAMVVENRNNLQVMKAVDGS